jgi:ribosomal protein L24
MRQALKRGNEVVVIAGDAKNQTGKVLKALREKIKLSLKVLPLRRSTCANRRNIQMGQSLISRCQFIYQMLL